MSANRDDDPRHLVEGSARSGPDSVDLKPYFGKMKIVLGFLALVMIGVQAWQLWDNPVYREIQFGLFGQGILWGENAMWEKSYQTCLEWYDPSRGCTADITPWRFMLTIVDSYWMNYLLYLVTLIILPSIFLFWRRPAPIRCNKALKAIYSWRRGRLFIHSGHYIEFKQKNFFDAMAQSLRRGPAVIELTDSRKPARKGKFKVGPYVSRLESQPARLLGQMRNFLLGYEGPTLSEARPRRLSYPFWEWSLLPPRRLPADIDTQAERWLREHGLHPDDADG